MNIPKQLKYTKDHEWAALNGETVTVGITDHAQQALGDVVFVDLPAVGKEVKKGQTFGTVESIKAVSDLYAPLSGKIVEVNPALSAEPSAVNKDPYTTGWMVKIQLNASSELSELMSPEQYQVLLSKQ